MLQQNSHNHKVNLLSDRPLGNNEFNTTITKEMKDDLERVDKLFAFVSALYDVLEDKPEKHINKWATLRSDDSVSKINNAFLL